MKEMEFRKTIVNYIDVDPQPELGFNFPFKIIIPKNLCDNPDVIYTCNLPTDRYDESSTFDELLNFAKKDLSGIDQLMEYLCLEKGNPMVIPAVPTMRGIRPNFLGRDCYKNDFYIHPENEFKDYIYKYENLADQHKKMMQYAIELLRKEDIMVSDKVVICGYSEGAKFASHFSILHPEMLKAVIAGGTGGAISMPVSEIEGYEFTYPTGISDVPNFNMNEFEKIAFFFWMGDKDRSDSAQPYFDTVYYMDEDGEKKKLVDECGNDTPMIDAFGKPVFKLDENGNYRAKSSLFSDQEVNAINKVLGTITQERFKKQEEIYNDFKLNAEFHMYHGDHVTVFDELDRITNHIDEFIEKKLKSDRNRK